MTGLRILAALALACVTLIVTSGAEARQRHKTYAADPSCNGTGSNAMPCEGVAPSVRGEAIAKRLGFGAAQKVYTPRVSGRAASPRRVTVAHRHQSRSIAAPAPSYGPPSLAGAVQRVAAAIIAHPSGCPSRAFCGCGAAVRIFGAPIRSLWLAANWFKFPRTAPAPGAVAVRRHHVFVLEADLGGGVWRVFDANSGRGLTRIHARSIAGYAIVNPRAG